MSTSLEWWHIDPNGNPSLFDYVAMGLTVIAFIVAFVQLARTRGAQKASERTEGQTRDVLIQNQIASNLLEISSTVTDLDYSVDRGNDLLCARTLVRYSSLCSSTATLMRKGENPNLAFVQSMESSSRKASDAKADIMMSRKHARAAVRTLYPEIIDVTDGVAAVAAELVFTVPTYGTRVSIRKQRKQRKKAVNVSA